LVAHALAHASDLERRLKAGGSQDWLPDMAAAGWTNPA
jgi:hypothetical protein